MVGVSRGRVILKNFAGALAPSTSAASYRDWGTCFKDERKISMDEPNCQTTSNMRTHIAVLVSPSHEKLVWIPTIPRSLFTTPSMANILFHKMDTATEPPIMEGR